MRPTANVTPSNTHISKLPSVDLALPMTEPFTLHALLRLPSAVPLAIERCLVVRAWRPPRKLSFGAQLVQLNHGCAVDAAAYRH